ncbi:response regulator [Planctomycetota bacterium]|nr:response regulator [Planctomycetota bacterium]
MRTLIAEDDSTCSMILETLLKSYGSSVVVSDGEAAVKAFTSALVGQQPFDLVCLDIVMPGLDGQACLRCLRAIEESFGRLGSTAAKILMTTSVNSPASILAAFRGQSEGYLVKPIERNRLIAQLSSLGFKPL